MLCLTVVTELAAIKLKVMVTFPPAGKFQKIIAPAHFLKYKQNATGLLEISKAKLVM